MERLARSEPREDRPRERHAGRDGVGLPGGQVRVVALDDGVEDALLDVGEERGPRPGRAGHELRPESDGLLGPDHVLVEVDEDLLLLAGVIGEVAVLGVDLVAPPEPDAAARLRQFSLGDQARQRAPDLEHARDPRLVVVGRELLLLEVAGEHDLGQRGVGPRDPRLDHRGLLLGKDGGGHDDARAQRHGRLRPRASPAVGDLAAELVREGLADAGREDEGERRLLAVGAVLGGDALPGDLVGSVGERVQARRRPGQDSGRAALPHGLFRHGARANRTRGRSLPRTSLPS